MSKHTPGPWSAFYKAKYDEWHVSVPISGSSMKLALFEHGICSENPKADARLIAAAPDLLEACKRMIGSLGVMVCDADSCGDIIFARAAIAKATGETL